MSDTVTITVERLKELEKYEARIKAKNAKDTIRLMEYDKAHPEKVLERTKRYKDKDRDAYNARRRELRKLKKEAAEAAAKTPGDGDSTSA
jgi:hypothetical protein